MDEETERQEGGGSDLELKGTLNLEGPFVKEAGESQEVVKPQIFLFIPKIDGVSSLL